MLEKIINYVSQRTTWLGLFLIYLSLFGTYFSFLDEQNSVFLIVIAVGLLIPENWPISRKILNFIAPILVHQISNHAILKAKMPKTGDCQKKNFDEGTVKGAFFNAALASLQRRKPDQGATLGNILLSMKKAKKMNEDQTLETSADLTQKNVLADVPATSSDATPFSIEAQVEKLISGALGNKESTKTKARIHAVGGLLATAVGVLLPLAKDKIDVQNFQNGISKFNDGLLLQEEAAEQIKAALKQAA